MTMNYWGVIIPAVASAISAIAACIACLISLRTAKESVWAGDINHCNERFLAVLKELHFAISKQDLTGYRNVCEDLFDLLAHEFVLWKSNMLPSKVLMVWFQGTSRMLKSNYYNYDMKTTPMTIWNEMTTAGHYQEKLFFKFMDCLFDNGDWRQIKALKKKRQFW